MRARKETTRRRTFSRAAASLSARRGKTLPLNRVPFLLEDGPHAIPQVALQFHGAVQDGAARAAGAFQLLRQLFQKRRVSRQPVDDRDGLAAAAFLFHPQLRGNLQRDRLIELLAALAVVFRPSTV